MSLWEDCKPWTPPFKKPVVKAARYRPNPKKNRVDGHNVKTKPCAATVDQIDYALKHRELNYRDMAAALGEPVSHAMVRHWRNGNLPRMYLRAKGLAVA